MADTKPLTSEEVSALVNRIAVEFASEDKEEMEMLAELPPDKRWLVGYQKSEAVRADLRENSEKTFPNSRCLKSI